MLTLAETLGLLVIFAGLLFSAYALGRAHQCRKEYLEMWNERDPN
jgi:hypothetical protein